MIRVETIPCKPVPMGKGETGYVPSRTIETRPGDRVIRRTRGNQVFIEIHRAGFWKRCWHALRGSV